MKKVLAICLDGYDPKLGRKYMSQGLMPNLESISDQSARFELDHGTEFRTGLAGEHLATGLNPADAGRQSAVHFDPDRYAVWQEGTSLPPFPVNFPVKTVVFDATYFDLVKGSEIGGMVNWGAHDPGTETFSRPADLAKEIADRFGPYPASKWIYGLPWNDTESSSEMGLRLTEAVEKRAEIAAWLFTKRLPDWDLALMTVSEAHSAIEGLWHGVDTNHPVNSAPSAGVAGEGLRNVYRAIDNLIGRLKSRLPELSLVVFSMHGMGPNAGDAANFLLLAELLFREQFKSKLFDREGMLDPALNHHVALPQGQTWADWVAEGFPPTVRLKKMFSSGLDSLMQLSLINKVKRGSGPGPTRLPLHWIPATRYQSYWPRMRAFCIPAYYDGRIRINLQGREKNGVVPLADYARENQRIVNMVSECRNTITGERVLARAEYGCQENPLDLSATGADIILTWQGAPMGFSHPEQGQIGPVPYRRTGGHSGGHGFAFISGDAVIPADFGLRSSFDIVPTLLDLLGCATSEKVSGTSLIAENS